MVRGLVDNVWSEGNRRLLSLYSYGSRSVTLYELDRRGKLFPISEEKTADPVRIEESSEGTRMFPKLLLFVAALILFIIVAPLFQAGVKQLSVGVTSYEEFLSRELSMGALLSTVAARVDYRVDLDEYWAAPEDVWHSRSGDCEDHAMVVSAYLEAHDISHTLLGLSLEDRLQGHVVVVADTGDHRVLIDPTMATTPAGIDRFSPETDLAQIAGAYATLPARVYPPNPAPGRPAPVDFVGERELPGRM